MADLEIPLRASPSLLYQNLSFGDNKFVYLHKSEPHLVNVSTKETSSIQVKDKVAVFQARVVSLNGQKVLALAGAGSTQIWDLSREKLIFAIQHGEDEGFSSRGIAAASPLLLVGSSTGAIFVMETRGDGGAVVKTLKDHREMIADIASGELLGETVFVSSDVSGKVIVWDKGFAVKGQPEVAAGDTATAIAITPSHIICGYGSGKIRIFNGNCKKAVEIAAHGRWINAIDYSPRTNVLVSVAEDMLLQFWKVPTASDPSVALKGSKFFKDSLLTGVKFTDDGTKAAATAYDTEKLFVVDAPQ